MAALMKCMVEQLERRLKWTGWREWWSGVKGRLQCLFYMRETRNHAKNVVFLMKADGTISHEHAPGLVNRYDFCLFMRSSFKQSNVFCLRE
jgi:hypothetical protein